MQWRIQSGQTSASLTSGEARAQGRLIGDLMQVGLGVEQLRLRIELIADGLDLGENEFLDSGSDNRLELTGVDNLIAAHGRSQERLRVGEVPSVGGSIGERREGLFCFLVNSERLRWRMGVIMDR
jgi:hypothetical protein